MEINNNLTIYDILEKFDDEEIDRYLTKTKIDLIKTHDGRVLYTCNLFDTSVKKYNLRYQVKGLILDELDNSIISVSTQPHSYINNVNINQVKDLYEKDMYSIILAKDGTTITIYNFDGTYYMSTGRSNDITNYYWNGDKTFGELFYESCQSNPEFVKDVDLTLTNSGYINWNIPENYCITLGFKHNDIHRHNENSNDVWLIRSYNRKTKTEDLHQNLENLKSNEFVNKEISWSELISKCSREQILDQGENFYGYILQSNNKEIPLYLQKVFIPSTLYKTLQHFFYSFNKNVNDVLTHENRYTYSIFRNILLNNNNFIQLLYQIDPNYNIEVNKYTKFITELTSKISNRFTDEDSYKDSIFNEFITDTVQKIKKDEHDFNIEEQESYRIINDYVKNVKNAFTLCNLYLKTNKK